MRSSHALALSAGLVGLAVGFVAGWVLGRGEVPPASTGLDVASPPAAASPESGASAAGPAALPPIGAAPGPNAAPDGAPATDAAGGASSAPPPRPGIAAPAAPPDAKAESPNPASACLHVRVLGVDGAPVQGRHCFVAGATAKLSDESLLRWTRTMASRKRDPGGNYLWAKGETGADGTLTLDTNAVGRCVLGVWGPLPSVRLLRIHSGQELRLDIQLTAPVAPAISGTVWDSDGARAAGVVVAAAWVDEPLRWIETRTGAQGRFTMPRLPPHSGGTGELQMRVHRPGAEPFAFQWVAGDLYPKWSLWSGTSHARLVRGPDPLEFEIALSAPASETSVRGRIILEADVALGELEVEWDWMPVRRPASESRLNLTRVAAIAPDGTFTVDVEGPGTVYLRITGPECGSKPVELRFTGIGEKRDVELRVVPMSSPRIAVLGNDGSECEFSVHLQRAPPPGVPRDGLTFGGSEEAEIEDDGRVRIPWGLRGRWLLIIEPDDEWAWLGREVEFDGAHPPKRIELERLAVIADLPIDLATHARHSLRFAGTWRSGNETGALFGTWKQGANGIFRIGMTARREAVEIDGTFFLTGYRPVAIGPVTLQPGGRLPEDTIRFTRD